jgi:hypothetical protein
MKGRIINTDEGTMLGVQLFQRKVVRNEYRRWRKASHPFAIVLDCLCSGICAFGTAAWLRGGHYAELIVLLPLFIWMAIQLYCRRQYNKQAPSGLKLE